MDILEGGKAPPAEAVMTAGWLVLQFLTLIVAGNNAVKDTGGSR